MQQLVTPTFLQKAKDWNTTIRNPHAESLFHYSHWCYGVEKEMLDMFRFKKPKSSVLQQIKKYFLSLMLWIFVLVPNRLHFLRRKSKKTQKIKEKALWETLHVLSVNWFLKRYSFSKALLLLFFPHHTERRRWFNYIGLVLLMGITLASLLFPTFSLVILFVLLIVYLVILFVKGNAALLIILPRLAAIILSAWIVIIFNTDLLRCFFDVKLNLPIFVILAVVVLLIILLFSTESQKVNSTAFLRSRIYNSLYIILLGLFYSLTSGLVLSSLTSKRILSDPDFLKKFYTKELYQNDHMKIAPCYPFLANSFLKECIGKQNLPGYINDCQHMMTEAGGWMKRFEPEISKLPDIAFDSPYITENEFFGCKANRQKLLYILFLDLSKGIASQQERAKSIYYRLYYTPPVEITYPVLYKQLFKFELSAKCYFEGLQYLVWRGNYHGLPILIEKDSLIGGRVRYFPGFLILFTFISIFLSIFLQVIIDDRKVTSTL